MLDKSFIKQSLDDFGRYVVRESRKNLTRKKIGDRGDLYKSLNYEVKVSKNSFQWSFLMEDYGTFKDKGVKGKESSKKAPNSPYKFGSGTGKKGGLTNAIDSWVRRNKIQFRKKNGQFMTFKSTAFLTTRSIYNKGIETTNFLTRPFELGFKRLPDELVEKFGLSIDNFLK